MSLDIARESLAPGRTTPSATVALGDTVARLRAEGRTIYNLGSGDPDFSTPAHIVEAGVESLRAGRTHYAPSRGIPALTAAIAASRTARTGVEVDPAREVIVTPSAKYALTVTISAVVGIGEKVMILSPSWVSYVSMVTIAGADPYLVALDAADGFRLTPEILEAGYQPGTRMLIINSPNNPTGRVFDRVELEVLAAFALEHDLIVLSDEIYEDIVYGAPPQSIVALPGMADRTIVISGFSKAFAMTGWRLGYLIAHADLTDRILAVHQHTASCTATFVQDAGVAALTGPMQPVHDMVAEYRTRVAMAVPAVNAIPGISTVAPDGAFYLLADISGTSKPQSLEFSSWVLQGAAVSVVPGSSFGPGADQHVRLALTAPVGELSAAITQLHTFVAAG